MSGRWDAARVDWGHCKPGGLLHSSRVDPRKLLLFIIPVERSNLVVVLHESKFCCVGVKFARASKSSKGVTALRAGLTLCLIVGGVC